MSCGSCGLLEVALKTTTSFSSPARLEAIAPMRRVGVLEGVLGGGDKRIKRWYPSFFALTSLTEANSLVLLKYEILASAPSVAIFPLGKRTSKARKCSLLSFARSSSLLLTPA